MVTVECSNKQCHTTQLAAAGRHTPAAAWSAFTALPAPVINSS